VRRSNTREDGRRNGVMLHVTNPEPALGTIHVESHQQTFAAGERNRARFDAWKRAKGLHHHSLQAAAQYHHSSFSEAVDAHPPITVPVSVQKAVVSGEEVNVSQPERKQHDANVEILSSGVKRMRSTLDSWKTGEVDPIPPLPLLSPISISIPEVKITPSTPRVENFLVGKGAGEGKELRTFLLGGERVGGERVSKGPATFEDMELKEGRKGLGIDVDGDKDRTPSVEDK
jgi:hypothetical protein